MVGPYQAAMDGATSDRVERRQGAVALAIGLAVGVISFLWLFGLDRALGTDEAYRWPAGDLAQHIAGAYAYLDGAWSFPLFHTDRLNAPDGVNIIFTDSAPFAGFLAKILHSLTGLRFNYLGAWFAIAWVGQATAGAYLMRQLGLRHVLFYLCGAVISLSWPPYLNRHFHLALGSHFLVLFAIGLYLPTARGLLSTGRALAWTALLGVAIWTHAYLFLMCAALLTAALLDGLWRRSLTWPQAAVTFAMAFGTAIALALIGGYQTVGSIGATGYGAFRMDLLAYVWPHGSALFPTPVIFDPQSAYEGYNYLGLGGIAVVLLGLACLRTKHIEAWKQHPALLLVVIGMLAFAITNAVSLGGHILVHPALPVEQFPFSTFRASGRFGWVFGYLIVFVGLALVLKRLGQRSKIAALGLACALAALQFADGRAMLRGMQDGWRAAPKPVAEAAMTGAASVHFAPVIDCLPPGPVQSAAVEMLAVAARAGVVTDDAHTARTAALDCTPLNAESAASDAVVVTVPETPEAELYQSRMRCEAEAGLLICRPNA